MRHNHENCQFYTEIKWQKIGTKPNIDLQACQSYIPFCFGPSFILDSDSSGVD